MANRRFGGQRAFVTGASRGLGRAIAVGFAREGARVGIGFRSHEEEARRTLELVESEGGTGSVHGFDVRDAQTVEGALAAFRGAEGIDVLVNNAAAVRDEVFAMLAPADWERVLSTNLTGTYHCCRSVAAEMIGRRHGSIVNVASVAALRASPGQVNYAASKGGILSLTRTLAAELAPYGVRVNAVLPGVLNTGMGERLDHRVMERRRAAIPLGRAGTGDEVARAVLFLASDEAAYIVGECLTVDGGLSL